LFVTTASERDARRALELVRFLVMELLEASVQKRSLASMIVTDPSQEVHEMCIVAKTHIEVAREVDPCLELGRSLELQHSQG
jgi:hypothetical protein